MYMDHTGRTCAEHKRSFLYNKTDYNMLAIFLLGILIFIMIKVSPGINYLDLLEINILTNSNFKRPNRFKYFTPVKPLFFVLKSST